MSKKQLMPLSQLNLTDRFLFYEVMEDPQAHQAALRIIFGRDISLLGSAETEKELRVSPAIRSIRMDVFSMEEECTVYNMEMQKRRKNDLTKRSRYYQALIDTSLLEPGIPSYNRLNFSYIILIMPFDLFGYGKYRYTFEASCKDVPSCPLGDGAVRIFLNTRGINDSEVSPELVQFLHYIEETTDEAAEQTDCDLIRQIHHRVRKVKSSEEIGVKYMQAWEERYYDKQEAREEGLAEGRTEGRTEARVNGILELLSELGTVPNSLENAISSENREEILKSWLKLAARAKNFSDFAKKPGWRLRFLINNQ